MMMGKVLPKLRGTEPEIGELVETLHDLCTSLNYERSAAKLRQMAHELQRTGFSSFF